MKRVRILATVCVLADFIDCPSLKALLTLCDINRFVMLRTKCSILFFFFASIYVFIKIFGCILSKAKVLKIFCKLLKFFFFINKKLNWAKSFRIKITIP